MNEEKKLPPGSILFKVNEIQLLEQENTKLREHIKHLEQTIQQIGGCCG